MVNTYSCSSSRSKGRILSLLFLYFFPTCVFAQKVVSVANPDSLSTVRSGRELISDIPGDSLLDNYHREVNSVQAELSHRIDSLMKLNQRTAIYTRLLDSLRHSGPVQNIREAEAKLASLEHRINQPLTNINSAIKRVENKI